MNNKEKPKSMTCNEFSFYLNNSLMMRNKEELSRMIKTIFGNNDSYLTSEHTKQDMAEVLTKKLMENINCSH